MVQFFPRSTGPVQVQVGFVNDAIDKLLKNVANMNVQNCSGIASLHVASLNINTNVMNSFLEHSADPSNMDTGGNTVLEYASRWNNEKAIHLLKHY